MTSGRLFTVTTVVLGLVTLSHAIFTWPVRATLAFFGGGALVAFLAEEVVINAKWLEHRIGPKVGSVPPYLLFGWTGTLYIAFRAALLVTDGWTAVAITGVLATSYDVLTDHKGVEDGHRTYLDDLSELRYRGVPLWNFLGWFIISCLTATLALPFL